MSTKVIVRENLEKLLIANWANFLDKTCLLRIILEHAKDADYREIRQTDAPLPHMKVTITKFAPVSNSHFELWIEFTVPRDNSVAVGTHIYHLTLDGTLILQQTYGARFVIEN